MNNDDKKKGLRVVGRDKVDSFGPMFLKASEMPAGAPIATFAHHEATLPDVGEYLVKGVIDKRAIGVLYGLSGACKSFLAIDLAEHIALGSPWNGRRGKQAFGVYIAAEGGQRIKVRIVASRQEHKFTGEVPVEFVTQAFNLLDAQEVELLREVLRLILFRRGREQIDFIIIDTLSQCIPGADENSNGVFMQVVNVAGTLRDEFGCAVLFIHHRGKDATKGPRGGSSLYAAADFVLLADRKAVLQDGTIEGELLLEKVRDYEDGLVYAFQARLIDMGLDADGDPITSRVIQYVGVKKAAVKLGEDATDVYTALLSHQEIFKGTCRVSRLELRSASLALIRARRKKEKKPLTDDAADKAWERGFKELVQRRYVTIVDKRLVRLGWEGVFGRGCTSGFR